MRTIFACLAAALSACSTPPPFEPTAEFWEKQFAPKFVQPRPGVLFAGRLDIPLRPGDQILSDCAEFFAEDLREDSTEEERREFESSIACIYPPKGQYDESTTHYVRAFRNGNFENDSGTYVQSGMNIYCNRQHSVAIAFKGKYVPEFILDETGKMVTIEGGGEFVHETLMFAIADESCERYRMMAGHSEPPVPEGYAGFERPNFLESPPDKLAFNGLSIPLRPSDRLVAHCAQYYREEVGENLPDDATPSEFAWYNQRFHCIHVPQDEFKAASAWYVEEFRKAGLTGVPAQAAPRPDADARFPRLRAGRYEWSGQSVLCGDRNTVAVAAKARHGPMVMLDPITGEFWSKLGASGGRKARLENTDYPHKILTINFVSLGCM